MQHFIKWHNARLCFVVLWMYLMISITTVTLVIKEKYRVT